MIDDEYARSSTGGWHAALAGAVLGTGLAAWWLLGGTQSNGVLTPVPVQQRPLAEPAQAPRPAPRQSLPTQAVTAAAVAPPSIVQQTAIGTSAAAVAAPGAAQGTAPSTVPSTVPGAAPGTGAVQAAAAGEVSAAPVRPAKLPPPSKRTSDDLEPEN